jgi:triacylglycerol lipase
MYAEDMYSVAPGTLNSPADARIAAAGWKVVGYLAALIPAKRASDRKLGIDHGKRVFYGFVAQSQTIPTSYVAVIRGTDGIIEWIIDAEFVPIPHPRLPNARVEQGFWGINQTMSLADPTSGVTTFQNAAEGVENLVGNGAIVVMGHSLGSALATYFVEDVAERLGPRATACLFASPRTGDSTWAAIFDQNVKQYSLFNYVLDLVPYLPTGIGYSTLPNATIIQPATAQAGVRLDLLCDHHVICYCYMLDFAQASAAPLTPQDAGCKGVRPGQRIDRSGNGKGAGDPHQRFRNRKREGRHIAQGPPPDERGLTFKSASGRGRNKTPA